MMQARGSVVIPAHNEASVIARCLDTLFHGVEPGSLEVVVACNGCNDETAGIARETGHPLLVIELAPPSKPAALRAADNLASTYPRIYLDADVELDGASAMVLLERLGSGGVLAGRPPLRYATDRCTRLVRSYYRARSRVPLLMQNLWGAGAYGLSEAGRGRFGEYPDVIAEDLYVDRLFRPEEIEIVDSDPVIVRVPRTVPLLLRTLRRTYRGKGENLLLPESASAQPIKTTSTRLVLRQVVATSRSGPAAAVDAAAYIIITLTARVLAALARGGDWERDDSSRAT